MIGVLQFVASDISRNGFEIDAGVHGAGFDGADHAFDDEGDDVFTIAIGEGGIADDIEEGLEAIDGFRAGVDERFNLIVQVDVADLAHVDGSIFVGRDDDDVIRSIDASVGLAWGEHRIDDDEEAASTVAVGRHLEIDIGVHDHFGKRVVEFGDDGVVGEVVGDPDDVEVDVLGEAAQDGEDGFDLGGVGRHVRLIGTGVESGRGCDVEGERDVLREVQAGIGKMMLVDEGAELVAVVAGLRRLIDGLVDLLAHLGADGIGLLQPIVVSAGIEGDGDIEESFTVGEADRGSGGIDERRRFRGLRILRAGDIGLCLLLREGKRGRDEDQCS